MFGIGRISPGGLTVILLALGCPPLAAVEDEFLLDLMRPRISAGFTSAPSCRLTDLPGEDFAAQSLSMTAVIPLGAARVKIDPASRLAGYQTLGTITLSRSAPEISFLDDSPQFYTGSLGVTTLLLSREYNLYVAHVGLSFAEHEEYLDDIQPRLTALGVGTVRAGEGVYLGYGAVLTYRPGQGMLLPGFGIYWQINKKWSFSSLIPFVFNWTYKANKDHQFHMFMRAEGEAYRFYNDGVDFPGQPEELDMRHIGGVTGGTWDWMIGPDFSMGVDVGYKFLRSLVFADDDLDILASDIQPTMYAGITFRYTFGKSIVHKQWLARLWPGLSQDG